MENNTSQEIDLRILYHKGKRIALTMLERFNSILDTIKKRWILLSSLSLIGIGLGVGAFYLTKPVYISTITLSSNSLNNNFCSDLINELAVIISDNTPELLAEKLNIHLNSAKNIKKIEFDNFNEKLKKKYEAMDTVVLGIPFKIKVHAFNNTVFDTLQTAIVNYLENNDYALKRKEIKRQNLQLMRQKLQAQILQLDSLKKIIATNLIPRGNPSGFVFGQPLDPINVYKEEISLFKNDLELNAQYILIDNIQVINSFSARNKPDSPRALRTIILGGIFGFLVGLVIAHTSERRRKNVA